MYFFKFASSISVKPVSMQFFEKSNNMCVIHIDKFADENAKKMNWIGGMQCIISSLLDEGKMVFQTF